jgi:SAM-dependent methyltransferase
LSGVDRQALAERMERYYEGFLDEHGPTALGVNWNSPEAQELRFRELMRVVDGPGPFSINDYGCGYGALVDHLTGSGHDFTYTGYDINSRMLDYARDLYGARSECRFVASEDDLELADYTVASGVFTLRGDTDFDAWTEYVIQAIHTLDRVSDRAFAFNSLTRYSDPERMRPDLYYADPTFFFDYCKRRISRHVALLHDYGAYEFTIIVRQARDG